MDYFDYQDECYCEFEKQIEDFKRSLIKAVKEEHREEIERLRKENEELQDIKARMRSIEKQRDMEKRDFERKVKEAIGEVKKARLKELLEEGFEAGWRAVDVGDMNPKCELCDKDRNREYTTPLGRKTKERCLCYYTPIKYMPKEVSCYLVKRSRWDGTAKYYRYEDDNYNNDEELRWARDIYDGKEFEKVSRWGTVFLKTEECQKYCDWLTDKENEDGNAD
jgi:hypothetical protein